MLITDENISETEIWRLREWRIAVRQVGPDLARRSASDQNVLQLLHRLKRPTFFTRDRDFWNHRLTHSDYCLVFIDLREQEGQIAAAIRRFLRHSGFDTHAKRMGKVVRVHRGGVHFWEIGKPSLQSVAWH